MTIGVVTIVSPVLAGNTSQTYWHNVYRIWSPYDHTPARRKETKSAYYNKTNHIKISGNYIVIGLHFMMAVMFQEATGTRVIKDK